MKTKLIHADFKGRKLKPVHLTLSTTTIERHEPVTKEFRKALKFIAEFYAANKRARTADYLIRPTVQARVIGLPPLLRRMRRLRVKWTIEEDQELTAMHSLDAEPDLKRALERQKHPERFLATDALELAAMADKELRDEVHRMMVRNPKFARRYAEARINPKYYGKMTIRAGSQKR